MLAVVAYGGMKLDIVHSKKHQGVSSETAEFTGRL